MSWLKPLVLSIAFSVGAAQAGTSVFSATPGFGLTFIFPEGTSTLGVTPSPEPWLSIGNESPFSKPAQFVSECEFRRQHPTLFTLTPYQEACVTQAHVLGDTAPGWGFNGTTKELPASWRPVMTTEAWWTLPLVKAWFIFNQPHPSLLHRLGD
jgi:hypothetical protein